jgi:hypothetical protein
MGDGQRVEAQGVMNRQSAGVCSILAYMREHDKSGSYDDTLFYGPHECMAGTMAMTFKNALILSTRHENQSKKVHYAYNDILPTRACISTCLPYR